MRLTASDLMTYWRPSPCELRVFLQKKSEPEAEPSAFDEVMRRLGIRHEQEHLATLGPYLDLSSVQIGERIGRTLEAIANKVPVVYQPAFLVRFRNNYLRNYTSCPNGLRNFWLGWSGKDMSDHYDKIREDAAFRRGVAEHAVIGFELPKPSIVLSVGNVPCSGEEVERVKA